MQLEQTVDESTEYEPAAQAPVTALRPAVAQYEPAVHAEQAVTPVDAMKDPAIQLEQLDEGDEVENVPAKQLEQTVDEATE